VRLSKAQIEALETIRMLMQQVPQVGGRLVGGRDDEQHDGIGSVERSRELE
jgi:hypothetical protein